MHFLSLQKDLFRETNSCRYLSSDGDKSTAVPIGICEDVPVEVANCLIVNTY